ncbi:MAG: hypothetical protein WCG73_00975 [Candidatus Moraniibacteriota bacterium]
MTESPVGWVPKKNLLETGALLATKESDVRLRKAVAKKADVKPVSSAETEESALRVFVESILDKGSIILTSKKGKDYLYTRDGSKLLQQKKKGGPLEDATEEAFKRKKNGWQMAIAPSTADADFAAEDLVQPAGEPVVAPAEGVGKESKKSQEAEELLKAFRKKLDSFDSKFEEMLQRANTLSALKGLYNRVTLKEKTADGEYIYSSEVIWHNFLPEITPVYSPLPPEQKTVASSLLEGKNNEYAREIKKKERSFKELKEHEFYQISNDEGFPEIVDKKVSEITEKIELAQSLPELESIGQMRSVKNKKERRFLSAEMFVDIENDPAMIVHINRVFDVEEDAVEKGILTCWEERLQALTVESERIGDQIKAVISEKERSLQIAYTKQETSEKESIRFSGFLRDLGTDTKASLKTFDIKWLGTLLKQANEAVFKLEEPKDTTVSEGERDAIRQKVESLKGGCKVKRTGGALEDGWEITIIDYKKGKVKVIKSRGENEDPFQKNVKIADLLEWNGLGGAEELVSKIPDVDESGVVNPLGNLNVSVDGNDPAAPVAKDKVATKKNTLRGVAMRDVTVHNIFDRNPFEGSDDSEEERGQTEEEKKYERLYQMLGNNPSEISFEEDRMKSAIATYFQTLREKMKDINLVEFVREHRDVLILSLSKSILIRLDRLPFDSTEKEFFAKRFIETYFEDRIK